MLAGKIWGKTEVLLKTPTVEVHRLTINPYSCCSLHTHQFKWNAFYVSTGKLTIETHKNDYALKDITELFPGDLMTVKPTEYHRFLTGSEGMTGIEIYYPEPLSEDIIRKDVGSKANVTAAPEPDKVALPVMTAAEADAQFYRALNIVVDGGRVTGTVEGEDGEARPPRSAFARGGAIGPYGNSF